MHSRHPSVDDEDTLFSNVADLGEQGRRRRLAGERGTVHLPIGRAIWVNLLGQHRADCGSRVHEYAIIDLWTGTTQQTSPHSSIACDR